MVSTWFTKDSIAASGDYTSPESVVLSRERTLSLTVQMTFHASGTQSADVELYYSPDNTNWDTVDYLNEDFDVPITAGSAVQRTVIVDLPEHGFAKIKIFNRDTAQAITSISVWYTLQSWKRRTDDGG